MSRPTLLRFRELLQDNGIASAWSPLFDQQTARVYEVLFPPALPRQGLFHADADMLVRIGADDTPEPHMAQVCDYHGHVCGVGDDRSELQGRMDRALFPAPCPCTGGVCAGVTSDNLGPGGTRCRAFTQEKL